MYFYCIWLRYGLLGTFLRNEGTVHPLRRFYRICHAMSSRKIEFLTLILIYDFGFTIYEDFGFTRLRVTAETPRQAIDEAVGRTAR